MQRIKHTHTHTEKKDTKQLYRFLMRKTASVRFYRSSKNRVSFQQGVV